MNIFVLLIFTIILSSQSSGHSYTTFAGTILFQNSATECYHQQVSDKKYKYLEIYFYDSDETEESLAYTLLVNDTKQIDSKIEIDELHEKYDLGHSGIGIGDYKICFKILRNWNKQKRIYLMIDLIDENEKSFYANEKTVKTQNYLSSFDKTMVKTFLNLREIQMEQHKHRQYDFTSQLFAGKTLRLVNFCNTATLALFLFTCFIHVNIVKALFENNSLPARIMSKFR